MTTMRAQCKALFDRPWRGIVFSLALAIAAAMPASAQDSSSVPFDPGLDSLLNVPVSTAAKYNQTVREVAGSVTIVTAEDIRRFGYLTLEDVLQSAVGFFQTNDRNYTSTGVRGFGRPADFNSRILLLLDGQTVNQAVTGSNQVGASMVIDLSSVKRIEIVRGPSSALYGTGAMFAIINVITAMGNDLASQANVMAGSAGFKRVSLTTGSSLGSRGAFSVSALWEDTDGGDLYFPEFDDPATNNGIARHLDGERRIGLLAGFHQGAFTVRARYGTRTKSIPTAAYGYVFNDPRAESTDEAFSAEVEYAGDLSDVHQLTVRSYVDLFNLSAEAPTPGPLLHAAGHSRAFGGEAALHWDLASTNRLTTGIEYRSTDRAELSAVAGGSELYSIKRPFSVLSLYAQNAWQLRPKVALIVGLRHDMNSLTGSATAPRLALLYDPWAGTTFKFMYGEAFRAANAYETGFTVIGSEKLRAERLSMFELIAMQRLGARYMATASAYRYLVRDLITPAPDSTPNPYVYGNLESARARGVELALDGRPSERTRFYVNYAFQHTENGEGDRLTNSPRHLIKGGLGTDLSRHVSLGSEVRGESSRLTVAGNETDPFVVVNANLSLRPFSRGVLETTTLRFHVANLFDTRYAYPGGIELRQETIGQDGRTFVFQVSTRF